MAVETGIIHEGKERVPLEYGDRTPIEHFFIGSSVSVNGFDYTDRMDQLLGQAVSGDAEIRRMLLTPISLFQQQTKGRPIDESTLAGINERRAAYSAGDNSGTNKLFIQGGESVFGKKPSILYPATDTQTLQTPGVWPVRLINADGTVETKKPIVNQALQLTDEWQQYFSLKPHPSQPSERILTLQTKPAKGKTA